MTDGQGRRYHHRPRRHLLLLALTLLAIGLIASATALILALIAHLRHGIAALTLPHPYRTKIDRFDVVMLDIKLQGFHLELGGG